MGRYWALGALLLALFLLLFLAGEGLGLPLLVDPSRWMGQPSTSAALLGAGLLMVDVALPVPSSLVMIAHGALFGVLGGTLLSTAGSTGATLIGFALGRSGTRLVARVAGDAGATRADALLRRWGAMAIVVTRPVPLVAETVAILAGASSLGWGRAALAAVAGALPPALLYALTGALAVRFQDGALLFGLALLAAAPFWLVTRAAASCPRRDSGG